MEYYNVIQAELNTIHFFLVLIVILLFLLFILTVCLLFRSFRLQINTDFHITRCKRICEIYMSVKKSRFGTDREKNINFLYENALNLFQALQPNKKYRCRTQAVFAYALKKLEKERYIRIDEFKKVKKRGILLEESCINGTSPIKAFFSKRFLSKVKKRSLYRITFEKTNEPPPLVAATNRNGIIKMQLHRKW